MLMRRIGLRGTRPGKERSPWLLFCLVGLSLAFVPPSLTAGEEGARSGGGEIDIKAELDAVLEDLEEELTKKAAEEPPQERVEEPEPGVNRGKGAGKEPPQERAEEPEPVIDRNKARKFSLKWRRRAITIRTQLNQKCAGRLAEYKRKRNFWEYACLASDLQRFDAAVKYYQRILKKGRESWRTETGILHRKLAESLAMSGRLQEAIKYAKIARSRSESKGQQKQANLTLELAELHKEKMGRLRELLKKIETDPMDAESLWSACEMTHQEIPLKIEEKVMLTRMEECFPDHEAVASGLVEYRLLDNCWSFGEYAAVLELCDRLQKDHPDHWVVKGGEVQYRKAEANFRLERFAEALKCYKDLKREYPKHGAVRTDGKRLRMKMRDCLEKVGSAQ